MIGAAAARPGMGWPQQAERMLGMEGINMGFSGKMHPYYATSGLLSDMDASVVVIDCEYNNVMDQLCSPAETLNHTLVFIRALKAKRLETPVLLIEGHDHARAWSSLPTLQQNQTRRAPYDQLMAEGMASVFYGDGALKLGGPIATFYEA